MVGGSFDLQLGDAWNSPSSCQAKVGASWALLQAPVPYMDAHKGHTFLSDPATTVDMVTPALSACPCFSGCLSTAEDRTGQCGLH